MPSTPFPRRSNPQTKQGHVNNRDIAHHRINRANYVRGALVTTTPWGTFITPRVTARGATESSQFKQFRVKAVKPDYLECNEYIISLVNGNFQVTISTTLVLVARPWKLQTTRWNNQTLFTPLRNVRFTYDLAGFPDGTRRLANSGGSSGITETQIIVPQYAPQIGTAFHGDRIIAMENPPGGTGVKDASNIEVTWVDMNCDGRVWAEVNA